jgi:hypothetical protein
MISAAAGVLALWACDGPGEVPDEPGTGGTASTGGSSASGGVGGVQPPVRDLGCSSDSDCCAVVDECYAQLWLVTQAQKAEVEAYIASLQHPACFSCIPPAVQVSCQSGQCVGVEVGGGTWPPSGLSGTHCGTLPTNGTGGAPSATSRLSSDGPTAAGAPTKFGCGPL